MQYLWTLSIRCDKTNFGFQLECYVSLILLLRLTMWKSYTFVSNLIPVCLKFVVTKLKALEHSSEHWNSLYNSTDRCIQVYFTWSYELCRCYFSQSISSIIVSSSFITQWTSCALLLFVYDIQSQTSSHLIWIVKLKEPLRKAFPNPFLDQISFLRMSSHLSIWIFRSNWVKNFK